MQEFQQPQSVQEIAIDEQPIDIDEQPIDIDEQPIDINEAPIDINEPPIAIDEQVIDVNEQVIIDRLVRFSEELWIQEEWVRETYSEAEWQEFIDSIKNP